MLARSGRQALSLLEARLGAILFLNCMPTVNSYESACALMRCTRLCALCQLPKLLFELCARYRHLSALRRAEKLSSKQASNLPCCDRTDLDCLADPWQPVTTRSCQLLPKSGPIYYQRGHGSCTDPLMPQPPMPCSWACRISPGRLAGSVPVQPCHCQGGGRPWSVCTQSSTVTPRRVASVVEWHPAGRFDHLLRVRLSRDRGSSAPSSLISACSPPLQASYTC